MDKKKKRKIKGEYPTYDLVTISDIFKALTPENMNRFFKDFKAGMSSMVHMRELTYTLAKEAAKKDGIEIEVNPSDIMEMPSFKWIDD